MILLVLVVLARSAEPAEETSVPVPSAVIAGGFSFPEWDTGGVPSPWTLVNTAATRRRIGPSAAPSESAAGYYALFAGSTGTRLL
jgi:hypothetical protein